MEISATGYDIDYLQRIAEEELHENPEQREQTIRDIRQWLYETNYMMRTDDTFILMFLRSCKFDQNETKEKISKYYALRLFVPDFYKWKDPSNPDLLQYLRTGICVLINYNTLNGAKVFVARPGAVDPWNTNFEDSHNVVRMVAEICILDTQTQIVGIDSIIDLSLFGFSHLRFFTPNVMRTYVKLYNGYPFRLKGIHILQLPTFAYGLLAIIKALLPSKLRKRIFLYGSDLTKLHERIPLPSLPEEYGGTAGPLSTFIEQTEQAIMKNKAFLKDISDKDHQ